MFGYAFANVGTLGGGGGNAYHVDKIISEIYVNIWISLSFVCLWLRTTLRSSLLEQNNNHYPPKNITWIRGNFQRSWSEGDVPFRRCQKICRRVHAGTQPHCEHTSWMFLSWEVGGWISEGIRQTTWLENEEFFRWKTFMSFPAAKRNAQTILRWKIETVFRWNMKILRTPPWRLLWCTRPALKIAGSLKFLAHFETEVWVFCCLDFWQISGIFAGKTRDA